MTSLQEEREALRSQVREHHEGSDKNCLMAEIGYVTGLHAALHLVSGMAGEDGISGLPEALGELVEQAEKERRAVNRMIENPAGKLNRGMKR